MAGFTKIYCPKCGSLMEEIEEAVLKQNCHVQNPNCSNFGKGLKCPKCDSEKIKVDILGLGDQQFNCLDYGTDWT